MVQTVKITRNPSLYGDTVTVSKSHAPTYSRKTVPEVQVKQMGATVTVKDATGSRTYEYGKEAPTKVVTTTKTSKQEQPQVKTPVYSVAEQYAQTHSFPTQTVKTFKDSSGQIKGVQDPYKGMSYMIPAGTNITDEQIRKYEKQSSAIARLPTRQPTLKEKREQLQQLRKQAKSQPSGLALTSRGTVYKDTGQTVQSVRRAGFVSSAYDFLPPIEKAIAPVTGSKEKIYTTYIAPRQKAERKSDYFAQEYMRTKNPITKVRQMGSEFRIGYLDIGIASAEVGAITIATIASGGSGLLTTKSAFLGGGTLGTTLIPATGTIGSYVMNPKDPLAGAGRMGGTIAGGLLYEAPFVGSQIAKTALFKPTKTSVTGSVGTIEMQRSAIKISKSTQVYKQGSTKNIVRSVARSTYTGTESGAGRSAYGTGSGMAEVYTYKGTKIKPPQKVIFKITETVTPRKGGISKSRAVYDIQVPEYRGGKTLFLQVEEEAYIRTTNKRLIPFARETRLVGRKLGLDEPFFKGSKGTLLETRKGIAREILVYKKDIPVNYGFEIGSERATVRLYKTGELGIKSPKSSQFRYTVKPQSTAKKYRYYRAISGVSDEIGIKTKQLMTSKRGQISLTQTRSKQVKFTSPLSQADTVSEVVATQVAPKPSFKPQFTLKPLPRMGSTPSYKGASGLKGISTPATKPLSGLQPALIPSTIPSVIPSVVPSVMPSVKPSIKPSIKADELFNQVPYSPPITGGSFIQTPPSPPPIQLPMGWKGGSTSKKKKSKSGFKFSPKYSASIEAGVFGIKGIKPTKGSIASGLSIRPILSR